MSWRHVEAAGCLPISHPPTKAVLISLAHHTNAHTGDCYPSLSRLMLFTSLSRSAVQRAVRKLEEDGLVNVIRGKGTRSSTYQLTLPDVEPIPLKGVVSDRHLGGVSQPPRGCQPDTQTVIEQQSNDARQAAAPLSDDWSPSSDDLKWSSDQFQYVDVEHETELFIDNAKRTGELYVNPTAAWRVWIRRGEAFAARDKKREADRSRPRARTTRGTNSFRQAADARRG